MLSPGSCYSAVGDAGCLNDTPKMAQLGSDSFGTAAHLLVNQEGSLCLACATVPPSQSSSLSP